MQSLWHAGLTSLEKELPPQQFNTWIRPLSADVRGAGTLRLVAPNRFVLQWVKDRFLRRIETEHMETYTRDVTYDLNYLGGSSGSSGNYRRTQEEDARRLERMARFEQAKNRKKKKK